MGACDGVQIVSTERAQAQAGLSHSHSPDWARSPAVRSGAVTPPPTSQRTTVAPSNVGRTVSHRQLAQAQLGSEPCYTDQPPFMSENA